MWLPRWLPHLDSQTERHPRSSGSKFPQDTATGSDLLALEEGNLNDLRPILGNDVAIKASQDGKLPYPDGTIIARLAWSYVRLEECEKAFFRPQSFVAGPHRNGGQFMVKDSSKYASTGGWGVRSI